MRVGGNGVGVPVGSGVAVLVELGIGVGVLVALGLGLGVFDGVDAGVGDVVAEGIGVGVFDALDVGFGDAIGDGDPALLLGAMLTRLEAAGSGGRKPFAAFPHPATAATLKKTTIPSAALKHNRTLKITLRFLGKTLYN